MLIHHQFGPMADRQQCWRSIGMLLAPWRYRRGKSARLLTMELAKAFKGDAFLFASGREGLMALLQAMNARNGEEIIVQGYTCVAVPNAIQAAGFRPVYADIDADTLNLDIEKTVKMITPKTRAILCQHTFGIPAVTEHLRAICNEHKILLIEDCAHVIPDRSGPHEVGHFGDALLFSFGRDKAISGVTGGAIICRVKPLSRMLQLEWERGNDLPLWTIHRLLKYPLIYACSRPLYGLGIGKVILKLAQVLRLLVPIYSAEEKQGRMPFTPHRMPNACAWLVIAQWRKLLAINDHRRALTRLIMEAGKKYAWFRSLQGISPDLPLQKFPLFLENADGIRARLKRKNIFLDDGWTGCVICPRSIDPGVAQYEQGTDPAAEEACTKILNLPLHPGMKIGSAERLLLEIDKIVN